MSNRLMGFVAIVFIAVFVAFTFPVIIDGVPGTTSITTTIDEGDSERVTENLQVTVVESTGGDVEVTATNLRTGDSETYIINDSSYQDYTLNGQTVTITAGDTTQQRSTLTVEYPRTFGWNESALWLSDNLGIFLTLIAFVTIMAGLGAVYRE